TTLNAVNLKATNGGHINIESGSSVHLSGDATVDGRRSDSQSSDIFDNRNNGDSSEIYIHGGATLSATNLNVTNGGYVRADGAGDSSNAGISLNGDANVSGEGINNYNSWIDLYGTTLKANNLNVTDGGGFTLFSSKLDLGGSGTATADGEGRNGFASRIEIYNGSTVNGNVVATNGGYLRIGGANITGNVTINANSMLRNDDGYNLNFSNNLNTNLGTTATTFNANSIFAPDILSNPVSVNILSVSNTAHIQPYLSDIYPGFPTSSIPVGSANDIPVITYSSITGPFSANVISPLDVDVEYENTDNIQANTPDTTEGGQVQLYFKSNQVNFNKLPGSENAHSLGSFLNNVINNSNTDPNVFTLNNVPSQWQQPAFDAIYVAGQDGNLSEFDATIPNNLSSHNAQAYWNHKSFVDSILANLDNGCNMEDGSHAFALNQVSGADGTGAQLASLRQATAPGFNSLDYAGSNSSNSSGVWASYNGNHQHTNADSGIGSNAWSSSSDGFTLGYASGGDKFSWGAAVGHQKSSLNFADLGATGNQDGYNAGLYASLKGKAGYLNGVLGYGNFSNDSYGSLGDASFKTKATSASLEVGKQVSNPKSSSLTPYASVLWTRINEGGATLTGSSTGLVLNSGTNSIFTTQLGVRYNHRMYDKDDTLKGGWQAGLAWLHQGGDTGFPVNLGSSFAPGAGTFNIQDTPLAGNSAVVQLGAYGRIHHNLIGFAGYQGTFGSSQKINAVNAGIGYQF
ncbi:MAG: autotransporter domain-containing protein, partial [Abditibacteriaceae bacterium]